MSLLGKETLWCLVNSSEEERFIDDIDFARRCLLHRNIQSDQIVLFLDYPDARDYFQAAASSLDQKHGKVHIHSTADFASSLKDFKGYKTAVVVATGHGDPRGITAPEPLTPGQLLHGLRALPDIEHAALVLGQCYAGTFEHLFSQPPKHCILGASRLHMSLSDVIRPSDQFPNLPYPLNSKQSWWANIFLLNFFGWLVSPVDTDDDGHFTLLDAYKWSAIRTNDYLRQMKRRYALEYARRFAEYVEWEKEIKIKPDNLSLQTQVKDFESKIEDLFLHQEPWISNPSLASMLELPAS